MTLQRRYICAYRIPSVCVCVCVKYGRWFSLHFFFFFRVVFLGWLLLFYRRFDFTIVTSLMDGDNRISLYCIRCMDMWYRVSKQHRYFTDYNGGDANELSAASCWMMITKKNCRRDALLYYVKRRETVEALHWLIKCIMWTLFFSIICIHAFGER